LLSFTAENLLALHSIAEGGVWGFSCAEDKQGPAGPLEMAAEIGIIVSPV
jgi:hypothetical protein